MNTSNQTEFALVKALSKGEIKAFNELFQIYGNRIFRFANGYLKSVPDSEELVQDVFMKIWEKRGELNANLSFKAYLFTIAFNIIRKQFVKRALNNRFLEQKLTDDTDLDTIQNIDYQSTKKLLDNLIEQLPPRRREVFIKSRIEGHTVKEIAEELGTSPKTVENQLGEALKFIRSHIGKEDFTMVVFFMLFYS